MHGVFHKPLQSGAFRLGATALATCMFGSGLAWSCDSVMSAPDQPSQPECIYLVSYPMPFQEDLDAGLVAFTLEEVIQGSEVHPILVKIREGEERWVPHADLAYVGLWRGTDGLHRYFIADCGPLYMLSKDVSPEQATNEFERRMNGMSK